VFKTYTIAVIAIVVTYPEFAFCDGLVEGDGDGDPAVVVRVQDARLGSHHLQHTSTSTEQHVSLSQPTYCTHQNIDGVKFKYARDKS